MTTAYIGINSSMRSFQGTCICFTEGKSESIFVVYFFADHQAEYIVSLSHCFFSRIKISC